MATLTVREELSPKIGKQASPRATAPRRTSIIDAARTIECVTAMLPGSYAHKFQRAMHNRNGRSTMHSNGRGTMHNNGPSACA